MSAIKARFIQHVGTDIGLRIYWYSAVPCVKPWDYHNAHAPLFQTDTPYDNETGGSVLDYPKNDTRWPNQCSHCRTPVPFGDESIKLEYQVFRRKRYSTSSGQPEPGDIYYVDYYRCHEEGGNCPYRWSNCDGLHLFGTLPNGNSWDMDSRARNCTMKEDKTHRCWIRHGDPKTGIVHVDKNGYTCQAGAGSIDSPGWHGFLDHGYFTLQRGNYK